MLLDSVKQVTFPLIKVIRYMPIFIKYVNKSMVHLFHKIRLELLSRNVLIAV